MLNSFGLLLSTSPYCWSRNGEPTTVRCRHIAIILIRFDVSNCLGFLTATNNCLLMPKKIILLTPRQKGSGNSEASNCPILSRHREEPRVCKVFSCSYSTSLQGNSGPRLVAKHLELRPLLFQLVHLTFFHLGSGAPAGSDRITTAPWLERSNAVAAGERNKFVYVRKNTATRWKWTTENKGGKNHDDQSNNEVKKRSAIRNTAI